MCLHGVCLEMLLLFAPIKIVFLFLALPDRHACGRGFLPSDSSTGAVASELRKQMHVVEQADKNIRRT